MQGLMDVFELKNAHISLRGLVNPKAVSFTGKVHNFVKKIFEKQ